MKHLSQKQSWKNGEVNSGVRTCYNNFDQKQELKGQPTFGNCLEIPVKRLQKQPKQ